jgi:hypothetical protein
MIFLQDPSTLISFDAVHPIFVRSEFEFNYNNISNKFILNWSYQILLKIATNV